MQKKKQIETHRPNGTLGHYEDFLKNNFKIHCPACLGKVHLEGHSQMRCIQCSGVFFLNGGTKVFRSFLKTIKKKANQIKRKMIKKAKEDKKNLTSKI